MKQLTGKITDIAKQKLPRYHWFTPLEAGGRPFIADFQNTSSLNIHELENLKIVAALASPFREQVPARYAAYMGRVGTPDFSADQLSQWANTAVDALFQ